MKTSTVKLRMLIGIQTDGNSRKRNNQIIEVQ